jgi:hypothetical protein
MDGFIKANTILVTVKDVRTSCGITYVREGSIIKVKSDSSEYKESVRIFRNQKAESDDNWHNVPKDSVRLAKEVEIRMWDKEIYFVTSVKTY